jgi:hypothetical protein
VIAYLDTSVLLRWVLDAPDQLASPGELGLARAVSSELLEIEGYRALDALRLRRGWTAAVAAAHRDRLEEALSAVDLLALSGAVWRRVRDPYPEPMSTLDAAHLASALLLRDVEGLTVDAVLTHDPGLAAGARAFGFRVVGDTA